MKTDIRPIIQIGVTTNIIEWYGFCVYGYLSIEFGKLFFNKTDANLATLVAVSTFSLSYLIRPLGSIFFGYLSDRYGRTFSLKLSTLLMFLPTIFMGILPTYNMVGAFSAWLLIFFRLLQGFSAGGELPNSACYVYESSGQHNRTVLCSSVSVSSMLGVLLGSIVVSILHVLFNEQEILQWAWRIPFLLSIPLVFWIVNIRRNLIETKKLHSANEIKNLNRRNLILSIIQGAGLVSFLQICFYILFVWLPIYLELFLKVPSGLAHITNTFGLLSLILFSLIASYISRYLGHKNMMVFSIGSLAILSYPLFAIMSYQKESMVVILFVQVIFAMLLSGISAVIMEVLGDLFPSKTRNIGMGISFTFASSLFGGTAPFVCTYLINYYGLIFIPPLYISVFAILSFFITVLFSKKFHGFYHILIIKNKIKVNNHFLTQPYD